MTFFYISFATDAGFLGATIVKADDEQDALVEASFLGLNPGGEAMILATPDEIKDQPDFEMLFNRLASRAEMTARGGRRRADLPEDMKKALDHAAEFVCVDCNVPGPRRQ